MNTNFHEKSSSRIDVVKITKRSFLHPMLDYIDLTLNKEELSREINISLLITPKTLPSCNKSGNSKVYISTKKKRVILRLLSPSC